MTTKKNRKKVWYEENKVKVIENKRKYRKEMTAWLKDIKANHRCVICRENETSCIEFHHINSEEKIFGISDAVRNGYSKQNILNELKKCIPICANCHRKIHKNDHGGNGKNNKNVKNGKIGKNKNEKIL